MKISHGFYAILVAFIWATSYFFQKELVIHIPSYFAISVEAALISLVIIPFFPKLEISIKENLILSTLWGILTYGSVLTAARLGIDASVAVIIGKFNVLFAIIFSIILCKERLRYKDIIGISVAFLGLLSLLQTPNVIANPLAFIFMILFAVSWGGYNVYIKILSKKHSKTLNPLSLIAWVALFSFPQTLLLSFFLEDWSSISINITSVICLVYLAMIGTFMALAIWSFLIQKNPMYKVAPFGLMVPIIGIVEAYIFSDELITKFHIISSLLIVVGIGIAVCNNKNVAIAKDGYKVVNAEKI